jgi:hypothetical protein
LKHPFPTLLLATIFGFSLLFFTGCPVRCDQEITYHDLPASAKAWVPYDNVQTFRMKHSAGAVTTFSQTAFNSTYKQDRNCPECCVEDELERISWVYAGDNPAASISLTLALNWDIGQSSDFSNLYLVFNNSALDLFTFDSDSVLPVVAYGSELLDSVQLQGTTYPDVYRFIRETGPTQIFLDTLWYQKANGILKFSMSSGENWELLP